MAAVALIDHALTTVENVRDCLGRKVTVDDRILCRMVNAASDFIATETGRLFKSEAIADEAVASFSTDKLVVDRTPITALTSISFGTGDDIDLTDVVVFNAEAGLIQRPGGWASTAHVKDDISRDILPGTEEKKWNVSYTGGWVLPKDAGDPTPARTLPYDLEEACIQLVVSYFHNRDRDRLVKSEKLLSSTTTFMDAPVPPSVQRTIDAYTRHL